MCLYILVDGEPVQVSTEAWGDWMEAVSVNDEPDREPTRRIASWRYGDIWVSTVFLGVTALRRNGQPLLFETMVFGGVFEGCQRTYVSKTEALQGHAEVVEHIRATLPFTGPSEPATED